MQRKEAMSEFTAIIEQGVTGLIQRDKESRVFFCRQLMGGAIHSRRIVTDTGKM